MIGIDNFVPSLNSILKLLPTFSTELKNFIFYGFPVGCFYRIACRVLYVLISTTVVADLPVSCCCIDLEKRSLSIFSRCFYRIPAFIFQLCESASVVIAYRPITIVVDAHLRNQGTAPVSSTSLSVLPLLNVMVYIPSFNSISVMVAPSLQSSRTASMFQFQILNGFFKGGNTSL